MEKWYEVAVSYVDDCGTETIATFDKLKDAKQYIIKEDILSWDSIEFAFIDKWYTEDGFEMFIADKPAIRYDKPAVIINKETTNVFGGDTGVDADYLYEADQINECGEALDKKTKETK